MRPITKCICGAHGLLAMMLVAAATLSPAAAHAVTFEQAAEAKGYTYGSTGPIDVTFMNIDDLAGVNNYTAADTIYADYNLIPGIDTNQFFGMTDLQTLYLYKNQITGIESGDFSGLENLETLYLYRNHVTSIESGDFSGLTNLERLDLNDNALTHLNLSGADFVDLSAFWAIDGNTIMSVDMSEASLSDLAFGTLMDEFDNGAVASMDLSGADLSAVADLSPMYMLYDLVTLDLSFAELPDVDELDDLVLKLNRLDNLALSWDQWWLMDGTTRTALTDWDAVPANTLTIIPEPTSWVLLTCALSALALLRRRRNL